MEVSIHNVQAINVTALSLTRSDNGSRFHVQDLRITDDQGLEFSLRLFFDKVSLVLPFGDCSSLDQADSSEDYMGVIDGGSVVF